MKLLEDLRSLRPARPLTPIEAYGVAERQAARLLQRSGIRSAPVPSEVITELPFVQVAVRRLTTASGAAKWVKPRWVILLNGFEPVVRQRFSLAHEFKHILDSPNRPLSRRQLESATVRQAHERLCHHFAACLLMPRPWVKQAWTAGMQDVVALAEHFDVSPQAMYIRLNQLRLIEPHGRHDSREIDNAYLRSLPATALELVA